MALDTRPSTDATHTFPMMQAIRLQILAAKWMAVHAMRLLPGPSWRVEMHVNETCHWFKVRWIAARFVLTGVVKFFGRINRADVEHVRNSMCAFSPSVPGNLSIPTVSRRSLKVPASRMDVTHDSPEQSFFDSAESILRSHRVSHVETLWNLAPLTS